MAPLFGTHNKNTTVTKLRGCSVEQQGSSQVGILDTRSSVSDMLDVLGWTPLSQRKQEARLILFYPSKASLWRRIRVLEENTA